MIVVLSSFYIWVCQDCFRAQNILLLHFIRNSILFLARLQEAETSHQVVQQEKFQLESNLKDEIKAAKVQII
jgi:hypothetical protein